MNDGGAGVLADGEFSFCGGLSVSQEGECDIFVVVGGFRVGEDGRHLFVVGAAEQEVHVTECLIGHHGECFGLHFEDGMSFKFAHTHVVLREEIVFRFIFARLEHGGILKFGIVCHDFDDMRVEDC